MRALTTLVLLCLASGGLPALAAAPVTSVPELDLSRYAGQWYEIAHLPVSFQRQCAGDITATYALRADGTIVVHNACRTREGGQAVADGVARRIEGHPGRLQVRFVPAWLSWVPSVWADYWIIALDPGYQWAIVGDPDREHLWILSREPSMPRMQFERLKARAEAMGYDLSPLVVAAPLRGGADAP